MKDHQLGYWPADDDPRLGNADADLDDYTDFPLGYPRRITDEWARRAEAAMAEHRKGSVNRAPHRAILVDKMTDGDFAGLKRRGIVIVQRMGWQHRAPQPHEMPRYSKEYLAQFCVNNDVQNAYTDSLIGDRNWTIRK